ncbi:MAG: FAD binding domain-containing protein [Acidimicrobiales bacterium]
MTRIEGLDAILHDGRRLHIGPTATHNQCVANADLVTHALPLVQACWEVASPALRNRATVVGNMVTAARPTTRFQRCRFWTVRSRPCRRGRRTIALADFYTGVRTTVLADEMSRVSRSSRFPPMPSRVQSSASGGAALLRLRASGGVVPA